MFQTTVGTTMGGAVAASADLRASTAAGHAVADHRVVPDIGHQYHSHTHCTIVAELSGDVVRFGLIVI